MLETNKRKELQSQSMSGLAQLLSEEPVSDATWLQRREQPASLPESVVAVRP